MASKASYAIAVESSENAKVGRVSATYVAQESCPSTCAFKGNGCYAESGVAAFTTRRLNRASAAAVLTPEVIAESEAREIAALTGRLPLRVHVVGDCQTDASARVISAAMMAHSAKHGQFAWTYTHAWRDVQRESWQAASVLASCETADDVREANARGYAAAIVVSEHASRKVYDLDGINVLPCPQESNASVTCASCGLCSRDSMLLARGLAVGFAAHSARADKVKEAIAQRNGETSEVAA